MNIRAYDYYIHTRGNQAPSQAKNIFYTYRISFWMNGFMLHCVK